MATNYTAAEAAVLSELRDRLDLHSDQRSEAEADAIDAALARIAELEAALAEEREHCHDLEQALEVYHDAGATIIGEVEGRVLPRGIEGYRRMCIARDIAAPLLGRDAVCSVVFTKGERLLVWNDKHKREPGWFVAKYIGPVGNRHKVSIGEGVFTVNRVHALPPWPQPALDSVRQQHQQAREQEGQDG